MKLMPARSSTDVVTDLDAIISESVSFRFNGKIHQIRPISLESFLKFSNAETKLMAGLKDEAILKSPKELATRYFEMISSVCDSITLEDIQGMEQAQVAALFQLVLDVVTGQVDMGEGKKKRKKLPIYESAAPSFLPSARESLVGPPKNLWQRLLGAFSLS